MKQMKYIKLFENFNKSDLEKELNKYGIENYTINSDGTIDVDGNVDLPSKGFEKIPFKFGKVTGNFSCSYNKLTSLEGSPYYVGGKFDCSINLLKNLKDSPGEVGLEFDCSINKLESLEGMTLEIGSDFMCTDNKNLKELNSISYINGNIECDDHVDMSKFQGHCDKIFYITTGQYNTPVWIEYKKD